MMAAGAACKFTLAPNNEAAPAALVKNLPGSELEIQFEHWLASIVDLADALDPSLPPMEERCPRHVAFCRKCDILIPRRWPGYGSPPRLPKWVLFLGHILVQGARD